MAGMALRITFRSDWHAGSGAGIPGLVDRVVVRDADGLPYLPGKTVFGLLRDAAERLAVALDEKQSARPWSARVIRLFGSEPTARGADAAKAPVAAAVVIGAARLDATLRARLTPHGDAGERAARATLRAALGHVRPGLKISPETGRALPKHLRFIELARAGLELEARVALDAADLTPAERAAAEALLAGAACLVESVGAGRRRGLGLCEMRLVAGAPGRALDGNAAAQLIEAVEQGKVMPLPSVPALQPRPDAARAAPGWRAMPLVLQLEEPLIVAGAVTGNVVETRLVIPGAMLLSALAPRLAAAWGQEALAAAIRSGALRVLDATPAVGRTEANAWRRGEPGPLCLFAWKDGGDPTKPATVLNRLQQPDAVDEQRRPRQSRALRGLFMAPPTAPGRLPDFLRSDDIATALNTHNTIDGPRQRPLGIEEGGQGPGVYSYQAINVAGPFIALLLLGPDLPAPPADLMAGTLRVGRSRKDGYGTVRLTAGAVSDWAPPGPPLPGNGVLHVRLLSDLLPRGSAMEPLATLEGLRLEIARGLPAGVSVALAPERDGLADVALRVVRHEGWQTRWGLPRPSLTALAAGGCARFRLSGTIGPAVVDALARMQRDGLGDRRAEGFGEVRFEDPLLTHAIDPSVAPAHCPPLDGGTLPASRATELEKRLEPLALIVERVAWQQAINAQAQVTAGRADVRRRLGLEVDNKGRSRPSMSQLGRLRQTVLRLERGMDQAPFGQRDFSEWLKGAFPSTLAGFQSLVAAGPHSADGIFALLFGDDLPPTLGRGRADVLKRELWSDALRALSFALHRAQKREEENVSLMVPG